MTQPPAETQPPADSTPPYGTATRTRRGMAITAIALIAVLVITGVILVAWLLLRDPDRDGAAEPAAAVDAFLEAVYRAQDAAEATAQVCSEARDETAMRLKIDSIREYQDDYLNPRYTWSQPEVIDETDQLAVVEVTITMITGDELIADQTLHVSVLDKQARGWWVCNVDSVSGNGDGEDDRDGDESSEDDGSEDDEDGDGEDG